ncbi:zinc finger C3H1 domain-containing protein-like isoform X3 [Plodia interpunctella]|uniref:zinc finger C3H1 domain-containing protein-like isoform X3 n=1 Tax=Plodia interpunctella TaxID=58824 RepID=UPI0023686B20|nr:zinc finger C3H1 domain-containing protein-like isoform X3 [Plodia interpunctella]
MACIESIPPGNHESEMEEGEIVDEFEDISSDEELLLRQRLHILETYNNVLEKKKAKDVSTPGKKIKIDSLSQDLSDISASELEDNHTYQNTNDKSFKSHKRRRRNDLLSSRNPGKIKEKKKVHRRPVKVVSESSEESDDEYRNKRRKLADAVLVHKDKNDTSSLSARLKKMLCGPKIIDPPKDKEIGKKVKLPEAEKNLPIAYTTPIGSPISDESSNISNDLNNALKVDLDKPSNDCELIDLCEDSSVNNCGENNDNSHELVDSVNKGVQGDKINQDSDEDLELLRKNALETKSTKNKVPEKEITNENETESKKFMLQEDDDNYTAELRLICLKSAYLKKAFEIKRRQKLKKRLSQSSILPDDFTIERDIISNKVDSQNNTDIESVDMEIGSDGDDKFKECGNDKNCGTIEDVAMNLVNNNIAKAKEDEIEEDEDLLRAKLLTSLSKNLPNLMDTSILDGIEEITAPEPITEYNKNVTHNDNPQQNIIPETKKFIIQLGESDSEGEHEATKNLTKMHMKHQHKDFQQQLDLFLKKTRKKVENQEITSILEPPLNPPEKFVPKSVKHLPKSEQIEYRNLVKRMAELEKMKQARQAGLSLVKSAQIKDTLKPRNVTMLTKITTNSNSDEKIALSSSTYTHFQTNGFLPSLNRSTNKSIATNKLQKENNPKKEEILNPQMLKSVKVSIVNDLNEVAVPNPKLSVQLDVTNNKKVVKVPKCPIEHTNEGLVDHEIEGREINIEADITVCNHQDLDKEDGKRHHETLNSVDRLRTNDVDDYKSPLQALETANWEADPNAFLCPFEVGGNCKDPDCKYLHPKTPSVQ